MNRIKHIGGGLIKFIPDGKEFNFGGVFGREDVSQLKDFEIGRSEVLDQLHSDYCTGFASCAASAIEEKAGLSPYWSFAVSKKLSGDMKVWGQDIKTALKVHTKFGAIASAVSPYNLVNKTDDFLRDINNWPADYFNISHLHQKKSYFQITQLGYKDLFDAIIGALWKFRDKGQAVITGLYWRPGWSYLQGGIIPVSNNDTGTGHSFIFIGKKTINNVPYLTAQLSNGMIGDNGYFYFPRGVVNKEATFGNFMFVNMPRDEAQERHDYFQEGFWGKSTMLVKKFLFL